MPMLQKTAGTVDIVWEGERGALSLFSAGERCRALDVNELTEAKIAAN